MSTTTPSNEKDVPAVPLQINLRDWFAGMVMNGVCANPSVSTNNAATLAKDAYAAADALLSARNGESSQ